MFEESSPTLTATLLRQAAFAALIVINMGLLLGGQSNDSFAVYWAAPAVGLEGVTFKYGMWQGISKLWEEKVYGLSLLLFFCSGLWPLAKLLLLLLCGLLPVSLLSPERRRSLLGWLCALGRLSFVDVWVVALVVLTIRVDVESLPGLDVHLWIQAVAAGGVVLFLFAVLLSQVTLTIT